MAFAWNILTPLFDSVGKLIGEMHTSEEERLNAKAAIMGIQTQMYMAVMQYEADALKMQADIIQTEAKGESWLQRSWRPVLMLTFAGLVVARWLGLAAVDLPQEIEIKLFSIIQLGIGGYVIGRSGEKIIKSVDVGGIMSTIKKEK
jgi:hypothetical protein